MIVKRTEIYAWNVNTDLEIEIDSTFEDETETEEINEKLEIIIFFNLLFFSDFSKEITDTIDMIFNGLKGKIIDELEIITPDDDELCDYIDDNYYIHTKKVKNDFYKSGNHFYYIDDYKEAIARIYYIEKCKNYINARIKSSDDIENEYEQLYGDYYFSQTNQLRMDTIKRLEIFLQDLFIEARDTMIQELLEDEIDDSYQHKIYSEIKYH